jgi:HTH-type transcriptional regulator / antitoxin HigA
MNINSIKMSALKYSIIKSRQQYDDYCRDLEKILESNDNQADIQDEIELLTILIEKWDSEHSSINAADPVELLHFLMNENDLKAKDLVAILGVSKGLVSDILNYKKGISKDIIRILSKHFKVSQEAFNRPYRLKSAVNSKMRDVKSLST